MKTKICYNIEIIAKALKENGYGFVKLPIVEESEDWERKGYGYYFAKPEVKSIEYYHSLWTSAAVIFEDGTRKRALGKGVTSNVEVIYLHNNDYVSPKMTVNDIWVEATEDITSWLLDHGVTMNNLEFCKQNFDVYETIEYIGVSTPSKSHGHWGYSSENLVLYEEEIKTILNSIEDELLREKVKCILYARVFKHRR